jgi:phospholipid/cholesterol/gamma-HCH transport system substrate-binding protein
METSSPSVGRILTMVLFTLSCIGLLLFLWLSFGGTIPLSPQGYEFRVAFKDASQLADQADVRIAGVSVGKVISKSLEPGANRTIATIQMTNAFAPIHRDTRAILRTKTILGETYVQLTPGSPKSPDLPDGGMLPQGQVQNAVQLDTIFNALDPQTRQAFRTWQQQPEPQQRARQPPDVCR